MGEPFYVFIFIFILLPLISNKMWQKTPHDYSGRNGNQGKKPGAWHDSVANANVGQVLRKNEQQCCDAIQSRGLLISSYELLDSQFEQWIMPGFLIGRCCCLTMMTVDGSHLMDFLSVVLLPLVHLVHLFVLFPYSVGLPLPTVVISLIVAPLEVRFSSFVLLHRQVYYESKKKETRKGVLRFAVAICRELMSWFDSDVSQDSNSIKNF